MNTCKTCEHWTDTDPGAEVYPEHGFDSVSDYIIHPVDADTYKFMEMPFKVMQCKHPSLTFCERPVEQNGFGVADGSTYRAALYTAEDFGCVRHTPTGEKGGAS